MTPRAGIGCYLPLMPCLTKHNFREALPSFTPDGQWAVQKRHSPCNLLQRSNIGETARESRLGTVTKVQPLVDYHASFGTARLSRVRQNAAVNPVDRQVVRPSITMREELP